MSITTNPETLLTEEMLAGFDERAPLYDAENRFFDEDFEEMRRSGLLTAALPGDFGGADLRLGDVSRLLRRIAYHAPSTAVAVNMHLYWTGVAADLLRSGDESMRWVLEEAANGKIFAALHGEAGNDLPLLFSTTSAERTDGGWNVNGHKIFGSLSPVWDWGGFHAMDTSDPEHPTVVHGFLRRDNPGVHVIETWDTLGMRATQSHDTVLDGAVCDDEHVALVTPAGFAGATQFHVTVFAWALTGFASVYYGAARRAFDITVETMPRRKSVALTRSMAAHPEVQHAVAEMRVSLYATEALLDRTVDDWSAGLEHPDWLLRIVADRHFVVEEAFKVVDTALDLSGGSGIFKRNRLEQLFRDMRMGRFHPTNSMLTHELLGKLSLGIDPDEAPRWG